MKRFSKWLRNLKCTAPKHKKRKKSQKVEESVDEEATSEGETFPADDETDASYHQSADMHTSFNVSLPSHTPSLKSSLKKMPQDGHISILEEQTKNVSVVVSEAASMKSLRSANESKVGQILGTVASPRVSYGTVTPIRPPEPIAKESVRSSNVESNASMLVRTVTLRSSSDPNNINMLKDALKDILSESPAKAISDEPEDQIHLSSVQYSDSLIKLKLREDMHDNSCTQWFALKSQMQLEAYTQYMRETKVSRMMPSIVPSSPSKHSVVHQHGRLQLSHGSVWDAEPSAEQAPQQASEDGRVVEPTEEGGVRRRTCRTCHGSSMEEEAAEPKESSDIKVTSELIPSAISLKDTTPSVVMSPTKSSSSESIDYENEVQVEESNSSSESDDDTSSSNSGSQSSLEEDDDGFLKKVMSQLPLLEEQGTEEFVMHLLSLKPSAQLINHHRSHTSSRHPAAPNLVLKWNFLRFSDSCMFRLGSSKVAQLQFDRTYNFHMTPGVYLYLLRCPMAIELYQVQDDGEKLLGKCGLRVGRCFRDVYRTHEYVLEVSNRDLCLCVKGLKHAHFGHVVAQCSVRGDQATIDKCRPVRPKVIPIRSIIETSDSMGVGAPSAHLTDVRLVSDAELQAFQDGLNLVLVRNKALHTTQEEITSELRERTTWMHEELKWRLTLQENAILCGRDPTAVKWRQWKDDTTSNVRYRPSADAEYFANGRCHIEIDVIELSLLPDCRVMLDDNVTHLYVEFAFLGNDGAHMETMARRKPIHDRCVRFKFTKVFDLHVNDENAARLAEMIRSNESITFTLVSQPTETRDELQSCTDCGVAHLMLFELLQSRDNVAVERLVVADAYQKDIDIGELKVRFVGVLAMRSMALHILTPSSFKIIR